MKVSKKVSGVEYAIRDIVSAAKDLEKQGRTIDYLNIGDPAQYGFHPPENVKQAFIDAIKKDQNYYSASEGIQELRTAIAEKENSKDLQLVPMMFWLQTESQKDWTWLCLPSLKRVTRFCFQVLTIHHMHLT